MGRSSAKLRVVAEEPIDIQALNRASILQRDWRLVHEAGDKGVAVDRFDRPRRWWRG